MNKKSVFLGNNFILAGLLTCSGFSFFNKSHFLTDPDKHSLFRVQVSPTLTRGRGFVVNNEDQNLDNLLKNASKRMEEYYKKYSPHDTYVNIENNWRNESTETGNINFFIHQKRSNDTSSSSREWLNLIRLNQLSIDRYGFEYDENAAKKTDSTAAKIINIVDWQNIDENSFTLFKDDSGKDLISFYLINKGINKNEIDLFANQDDKRYVIADENKNQINHKWFLWLDKDFLTIKLNYLLHTAIFNDSKYIDSSFVTDIVGKEETRSDDYEKKYEIIKKNYESLSAAEKKFAEDYLSMHSEISISDNTFPSLNQQIKTDKLNQIYNKFLAEKKDVSVFNSHLLAVYESGKDFPVLFPKMNPKEIKEIKAKNNTDKGDKINIHFDKAKNPFFTNEIIFELLKKYSVKDFSIKKINDPNTQRNKSNKIWPSSIYSTSTKDMYFEQMHVMDISHQVIAKKDYFWPIIAFLIFLLSVGLIVSLIYRVPGAIAFLHVFLSWIIFIGISILAGMIIAPITYIAGILLFFFSLMQGLHYLKIFQHVLKRSQLPKLSKKIADKKTAIFLFDSSFVFFVFSTLISFSAPVSLRLFGIIFSFGILAITFLNSWFFYWNFSWFINKNYAKKVMFMQSKIAFEEKNIFNLNSWHKKLNTYIFALFLICICAIGLFIFNFSFNSMIIFKKTYLLSIPVSGNALINTSANDFLETFKGKENFIKEIFSGSVNKFYWISTTLDQKNLQDELSKVFIQNSYSLQETFAFSGISTFMDTLQIIKWILIINSGYLFIRFGFVNSLNLWFSFLFLSTLFFSLMLIAQIPINIWINSIFLFFCSMLLISIIKFSDSTTINRKEYVLFDFKNINKFLSNWFKNEKISIFTELLIIFVWIIVLCLSYSSVLFFTLLNIGLIKFLSPFIFMPVHVFVWKTTQYVKYKYLSLLTNKNTNKSFMQQMLDWDEYDEEIIEKINS